MSIPLLRELHEDVRRLVIAGAGVAADDLRLKRALPQLQQFGEKAPIFKRVAEEVAVVTSAQPEQAAGKLLDLAVLLHAVLHTQSSAVVAGELVTAGLAEAGPKVVTDVPYRKLKPLIDALTQRGSGRLEIIRQAVEDKLFADIRTFVPAVIALEDSYSEIADFVAEHVIPIIGAAALPILHAQLDMQGGSGDARKVVAIYKLSAGSEELWAMILSASKEGALPVRLAAITLAAGVPCFEEELIDLSHDRKKEVRSAALLSLSSFNSDKVIDRLMEALLKKDTEIAIAPIQNCKHPRLTELLLQYSGELRNKIVAGDKELDTLERFGAVITSLRTKSEYLSVREHLIGLLDQDQLDFHETETIQKTAADILCETKDDHALAFLHELRDRRGHLLAYSLKAALHSLNPAELFDRYQGFLTPKRSKNARELIQAIYEHTPNSKSLLESEYEAENHAEWDKRWVGRFVELNEEELVCRLVEGPDQRVISYLLEKYKVAPQLKKPRTVHILYTLFRLGYKEAPELLMAALEQASSQPFYYMDREVMILLALLPSSYAERLHQIADKINNEHTRNQMKELADHIAAKPADFELKVEGAGFLAWIKNKRS